MSKLTTFQELRHKCAELYCPKDWTTNLWADFFGDCMRVTVLSEPEKTDAVNQMCNLYNVKPEVIANVAKFISESI